MMVLKNWKRIFSTTAIFSMKTSLSIWVFKRKNYYKNPVKNLKREGFFSTFENGCFDVEEIETTSETMETFITKNGRDLTELFWKSDVIV